MFERAQEQSQKLEALQQTINSHREELLSQIQVIDREWASLNRERSPERSAALGQLEELYRLLSYFTRWQRQLQERFVLLAM